MKMRAGNRHPKSGGSPRRDRESEIENKLSHLLKREGRRACSRMAGSPTTAPNPPPESEPPDRCICVWWPSGSFSTKSWALARLQAAIACSSVAVGAPVSGSSGPPLPPQRQNRNKHSVHSGRDFFCVMAKRLRVEQLCDDALLDVLHDRGIVQHWLLADDRKLPAQPGRVHAAEIDP